MKSWRSRLSATVAWTSTPADWVSKGVATASPVPSAVAPTNTSLFLIASARTWPRAHQPPTRSGIGSSRRGSATADCLCRRAGRCCRRASGRRHSRWPRGAPGSASTGREHRGERQSGYTRPSSSMSSGARRRTPSPSLAASGTRCAGRTREDRQAAECARRAKERRGMPSFGGWTIGTLSGCRTQALAGVAGVPGCSM